MLINKEVRGRVGVDEDDDVEEEVINQVAVRRPSRKGKRNWSPSYILGVYTGFIARHKELNIGVRKFFESQVFLSDFADFLFLRILCLSIYPVFF